MVLAAPLTVVTTAACLAAITAGGTRLVIRGDAALPAARVVASASGAAHDYPRTVAKAPAAPAARQARRAPSQSPVAHHPRRHGPKPKSRRPAHSQRASHHNAPARADQLPRSPALMVLDSAVLTMRAAGASPALLGFINQPQNLVSTPRDRAKPLMSATRIQVFSSYASIAHAIASHHIAAGTRAVVYDNERSTGTPENELADPVRYCRMTAQLLHKNHLEYIASPGFDLSGPRPANGQWFQQFVRAGLMNCGRYADYLDIQDQLMQGTSIYAADAQAAAALLHQINPRAKLLMGLSSSPSGRLATAGRLWQAYQDTSRFVNGYWLNVPHNVSGHSRPSVALQFLQNLITHTR
jgi:hypothetical protein